MTSIRSDDGPGGFAFYHYNPSMGGAVLFTILFMGTTFHHIYQMFKAKTWFFIPFMIGGLRTRNLALCAFYTQANMSSRDYRIYRACLVQQTNPRLDARTVHHADPVSASCPSSFSSLNLHVSRPDYSGAPGRIAFHFEKEMAYEDFRDR